MPEEGSQTCKSKARQGGKARRRGPFQGRVFCIVRIEAALTGRSSTKLQRQQMIPVGYMAKRISKNPDWLGAPQVVDVYSVSGAFPKTSLTTSTSGNTTATGSSIRPKSFEISRGRTQLTLREHPSSITKRMRWSSMETLGVPTRQKDRFQQVWFLRLRKHLRASTWSPSANAPRSPATLWAKEIRTNAHCLFPSFHETEATLTNGAFVKCEPGPYRIFAVYSVSWPESSTGL